MEEKRSFAYWINRGINRLMVFFLEGIPKFIGVHEPLRREWVWSEVRRDLINMVFLVVLGVASLWVWFRYFGVSR